MEAEMSMSAGGFDEAPRGTGGEMGLSVLDDFEASINIGMRQHTTVTLEHLA